MRTKEKKKGVALYDGTVSEFDELPCPDPWWMERIKREKRRLAIEGVEVDPRKLDRLYDRIEQLEDGIKGFLDDDIPANDDLPMLEEKEKAKVSDAVDRASETLDWLKDRIEALELWGEENKRFLKKELEDAGLRND